MTGAEETAATVRITGRVQGVYYRAWTREQASLRGLRGWVENRADGSVAALFIGPRTVVEEMLAACAEGPLDARVERVEPEWHDPPPGISGFAIHA